MDHRVNHIHYSDVAEIIRMMIKKNLHSKIYNIVAPFHPTKREIINHQKKENKKITTNEKGKIILSEKVV